jgi:collagenase-like PrtC family protease
MPADFLPGTVAAYAKLNESACGIAVHETYGNLNPSPFQSGRSVGPERLPRVSEEELAEYLRVSTLHGIGFNYTLNASCLGGTEFTARGLRSLLAFIDRLVELGVRCLTLTSPAWIGIVRAHWPELEICASAVCELDSTAAARMFAESGVDRIVVSEDVNRRFDVLSAMRRASSVPMEAIANTTCLFRCPWKPFHFNLVSHLSHSREPDLEAYYHGTCQATRLADPAELLRLRWIRPEDTGLYDDVTYFKIAGRYFARDSALARVAQAYMDGHFDGNLWDLLGNFAPQRRNGIFIDNAALDGFAAWFKAPGNCRDMACRSCGHCSRYARRAVGEAEFAAARIRSGGEAFDNRMNLYHETGRPMHAVCEEGIWLASQAI